MHVENIKSKTNPNFSLNLFFIQRLNLFILLFPKPELIILTMKAFFQSLLALIYFVSIQSAFLNSQIIVMTSFSGEDGWKRESYGDWSQTVHGMKWSGEGVNISSSNKYLHGYGIGFNDEGDAFYFPPLKNPGILSFYSKLSSPGDEDENVLSVQMHKEGEWQEIGFVKQSENIFQKAIIPVNIAGEDIQLRIFRTKDQRSHYLDDIQLTEYKESVSELHIEQLPVPKKTVIAKSRHNLIYSIKLESFYNPSSVKKITFSLIGEYQPESIDRLVAFRSEFPGFDPENDELSSFTNVVPGTIFQFSDIGAIIPGQPVYLYMTIDIRDNQDGIDTVVFSPREVILDNDSIVQTDLTNGKPLIINNSAENESFVFKENFENGNTAHWNDAKDWTITTDRAINGNSLKHNLSGVSGTSTLSANLPGFWPEAGYSVWKCILNNSGWSPSSSNNFQFYLVADGPLSNDDTDNGYAVGVNKDVSDDLLSLWRIRDGASERIITTGYSWQSDNTIAIQVERTTEGVFVLKYNPEGNFDSMIYSGEAKSEWLPDGRDCGLVFNYTSTRAGKLWLDDIEIRGPEIDSSMIKHKSTLPVTPQTQIEAGTIVPGHTVSPVPVFTFDIRDIGDDDKNTYINKLTIAPGESNNTNWEKCLKDAFLEQDNSKLSSCQSVISDSKIEFSCPADSFNVGNDKKNTFTLFISAQNKGMTEGDIFQFSIPGDLSGWEADTSGTLLTDKIIQEDISSNPFTIDIQGSTMNFKSYPVEIQSQSLFSIETEVTDKFGNRDVSFSKNMTLQVETGRGTLQSKNGLTQKCSQGIARWTDLQYSSFDNFTILTTTDSFPPVEGDIISISGDTTSSISQTEKPSEEIIITPAMNLQDNPINLIKLNIRDKGTGDKLPTNIKQLQLMTELSVSSSVETIIKSIVITDQTGNTIESYFSINDNNIEIMFDEGVLSVPDGDSAMIEIAFIPRFDNVHDGLQMQVYFSPENPGIETYSGSSTVQKQTVSDFQSPLFTFDVKAQKLSFMETPDFVESENTFAVSVCAIDSFGNIDTAFEEPVSLKLISGSGELQYVGDKNNLLFNKGIIEINNLQYNGTAGFVLEAQSEQSWKTNSDTIYAGINSQVLFSGDFEKNNLNGWHHHNNEWKTSSYNPINDNYSLKHNVLLQTGESQIAHDLPGMDYNGYAFSWKITLQTDDWLPSSSNFIKIRLDANKHQLAEDDVAGVFMEYKNSELRLVYGDTTGNEVTLIKQTVDFCPGEIIRLKVSRLPGNRWKLTSHGSSNIKSIKSIGYFDIESCQSVEQDHVFGITFSYTKTRSGHLKFDDINIKKINMPPLLKNVHVLSRDTIQLNFSEPLADISTKWQDNYRLTSNEGAHIPIDTIIKPANKPNTLLLAVRHPTQDSLQLKIDEITDLHGCSNTNLDIKFPLVPQLMPGDIVINEIMVDPSPPVNLPESEYIELYNATIQAVYLHDWILVVNDRIIQTDSLFIPGKGYAIICHSGSADLYQHDYCYGLLTSYTLMNSGARILLKNKNETLIDSVSYSTDNYTNSNKTEGGWSLERMPENTCYQQRMFYFSNNQGGGTPGRKNSSFAGNTDTVPPDIIGISAITNKRVKFQFSEPVENIGPDDLHIHFNDNTLNDVTVERYNDSTFCVKSGAEFIENARYYFEIDSIADLCDNVSKHLQQSFWYYLPKTGDVVINEIMPDPKPAAGLPEYEYIELVNTTDYPININTWKLTIGSSLELLPDVYINPGEYVIMCDEDAQAYFQEYGRTLSIPGLSALPNGNSLVILQDSAGQLISFVDYMPDWHYPAYKSGGGWSLERIDYSNPSSSGKNWVSSSNNQGGTPGQKNAVYSDNPDLDNPEIENVFPVTNNTLKVDFNEPLTSESIKKTGNFLLEPNIQINDILSGDMLNTSFFLSYKNNFIRNQMYTLCINTMTDLNGNSVEDAKADFALPDTVVYNDVIINEVMFNPLPSGTDFVEIYNRSDKVVDIAGLQLANKDEKGEIKDAYRISTVGKLMFPGDYIILTENKRQLENAHQLTDNAKIRELTGFPSFPDDEGYVILMNLTGQLIDEFSYHEDMHHELLQIHEGVSLERISYDSPASNPDNWQSAASSDGYSTPGFENSQYSDIPVINSKIAVEPEIFSPDNDGIHDVLKIHYHFQETGNLLTIQIFDRYGRLQREVAKNELCGHEGFFIWDGTTEEQALAKQGIYIVFAEIVKASGKTEHDKKTCVLAKNFK